PGRKRISPPRWRRPRRVDPGGSIPALQRAPRDIAVPFVYRNSHVPAHEGAIMTSPIYRRVVLKASGEALMGDQGFGIDVSVVDRIAADIAEARELGVEVGVVIGG